MSQITCCGMNILCIPKPARVFGDFLRFCLRLRRTLKRIKHGGHVSGEVPSYTLNGKSSS